MGGGASSLMESMEELMTTTVLIGRALSSVAFPGMFRIYDFHSRKAPRLKNARIIKFFPVDSDEESGDEDENAPDPSEYEHFFKVMVGEDAIYLEDPLYENEAGWTALHACCTSLTTASAGLKIIDEIMRKGGSLEIRTKFGPGSFNKGWTPLQMACAYGVEPLVDKLIECGADANSCNSFGFSCLLEASHRGFLNVTKSLLKGRVDLAYIPSEEDSRNSPFASAPSQSALGEAARCGYFKVVEVLLEAGAPKNLVNRLGWSPLHEACFYNRVETVKILLLNGTNATLRTNRYALPYHLASNHEIKAMLEDMGGPEAMPENENDKIDMMTILTELSMPPGYEMVEASEEESKQMREQMAQISNNEEIMTSSMPIIRIVPIGSVPKKDTKEIENEYKNDKSTATKMIKDSTPTKKPKDVELEEKESPLLHSGPILGNLPSLTPSKSSPPKKLQSEINDALTQNSSPGKLLNNPEGSLKNPSRKADDKTKKNKKKKTKEGIPKNIPAQYLCQLTQRPMTDPVKTVYGNIYDESAIKHWLSVQGKICPLTGAPLAEVDLSPVEGLGQEIKEWILQNSTKEENIKIPEPKVEEIVKDKKSNIDDDLYEF